ncbi:MAG TPA: hypothetical protein VJ599_07905 [Nitrososphaeraceae archaeon]|nr:hypothetical protein [Nitrososphaeraceae archaeon]
MKKNNVLYAVVFTVLLLVTSVASTNLKNIYGQDEEGDIDTNNEITSQFGPEVLANETVSLADQNGTSLINPGETGIEGMDNFSTPSLGNESLLSEDESFDTGNESLLSEDESFDTGNESLLSEQDGVEDEFDEFDNETMATETEAPPVDNASGLGLEDDSDIISQSEQGITSNIDQKLESVAATTLGLTNATAGEDNEQMTNVQQVINNIANAGSQGGDINVIVNQISQIVANNPNSPAAIAIKKLAQLYSNGDIDEIDIATQQIGTQIAQGNNIEQTLVQITNNIENNIKNIKISIDNFDKIIVHPNTLDVDKKIITETVTTIKESKSVVDVPRIHIKFDNDEKNLVLRVLNTNDAKYEMPFSKSKGGFELDDDEFRVKVIGGKGKIQAASMAQMLGDGKVGDKEFLDKDRRNGNVYFNTDEIDSGKYLLEVYIKLSDGSIGTWARGSVTVTN